MLCAADRREDEPVPQFYGRIDEKFAEWETDVSLWQVEFKLEDRDRLGPRLYVSERFAWTAEDHCENEARNTRCCTIHSGQHHSNASKTTVMDNFLRSLDRRHCITTLT